MHDAAAVLILGPAAALMFVLFGTRACLAITGRMAGPRLRAIVGLESEVYITSRGGLVFDVAFALIGELLILALLIDNLHRPDGQIAVALAGLEIVLAGIWIVGLLLAAGRTAGR